MLGAICSWHTTGNDRFKLHRVQVAPCSFIPVILHAARSTALRTSNRVVMRPMNLKHHAFLIHLQID
jgi:hypothetical protein